MSKVNIKFANKKRDYKNLEVPLYIVAGSSLYQIIKMVDDKYCLYSTDNGHIQTNSPWDTIEEFFKENPEFEIVDVNIDIIERH